MAEPTGLRLETAAEHATAHVPVADPSDRVADVRALLASPLRYESATHIVVCRDGHFEGMVTIEDLLGAPGETSIATLMDRRVPVVSPGIDQEVAAARAVRHGESALAVVDRNGRFAGVIPPHRLLTVLLDEH